MVCPDLPGYGASDPPAGEDSPQRYAKRVTAATMVALMQELGHERFGVVGHDLGVLDIIPTVDNWAALNGVAGVFAFHLFLLAQPTDLPERLVGADPDRFFGHFLDTWV